MTDSYLITPNQQQQQKNYEPSPAISCNSIYVEKHFNNVLHCEFAHFVVSFPDLMCSLNQFHSHLHTEAPHPPCGCQILPLKLLSAVCTTCLSFLFAPLCESYLQNHCYHLHSHLSQFCFTPFSFHFFSSFTLGMSWGHLMSAEYWNCLTSLTRYCTFECFLRIGELFNTFKSLRSNDYKK